MADLPLARLSLLSPPFYSTGVYCFGPVLVKVGEHTKKHWEFIFTCLTTKAVQHELLNSLDSDAFLLALRRFISRQAKPMELLLDRDTNFCGAERELQETRPWNPCRRNLGLNKYHSDSMLQALPILVVYGKGDVFH